MELAGALERRASARCLPWTTPSREGAASLTARYPLKSPWALRAMGCQYHCSMVQYLYKEDQDDES